MSVWHNKENFPQGHFTTIVELEDVKFEMDVRVVSQSTMKLSMVIGKNLMNEQKRHHTQTKIEAQLMCIQVTENILKD